MDKRQLIDNRNPRPLKVYKTYQQQIDLLCERELIINDPEFAVKWLQEVGYYRLGLYTHHFWTFDGDGQKLNRFQEGTSFEEIVSLYIFDRGLSLDTPM